MIKKGCVIKMFKKEMIRTQTRLYTESASATYHCFPFVTRPDRPDVWIWSQVYSFMNSPYAELPVVARHNHKIWVAPLTKLLELMAPRSEGQE